MRASTITPAQTVMTVHGWSKYQSMTSTMISPSQSIMRPTLTLLFAIVLSSCSSSSGTPGATSPTDYVAAINAELAGKWRVIAPDGYPVLSHKSPAPFP